LGKQYLQKEILASNYLHADETQIKVLDKDEKGETHRGIREVAVKANPERAAKPATLTLTWRYFFKKQGG
jgi:hypothetical protein